MGIRDQQNLLATGVGSPTIVGSSRLFANLLLLACKAKRPVLAGGHCEDDLTTVYYCESAIIRRISRL